MQARLPLLACACAALLLPGRAAAETVTIELTSLTMLQNQQLTKGKQHPTRGDLIEFRDLLLNRGRAQFGKRAGRAVAWDEGIVRYTSATSTTIEVLATFPDLGTLTFAGPLVAGPGGNTTVPITAGTGAFKGAKGTVTIGHGSSSAPNTYRIRVPGNPIELGSGGQAA